MFLRLILLHTIVLLISCRGTSLHPQSEGTNRGSERVDFIGLKVSALDLTEDMSSLSSQNDEITILMYATDQSNKNVTLLLSGSFTVTKQNNLHNLILSNSVDMFNQFVTVIMIERDTEDTTSQLDEMVRVDYDGLRAHYRNKGNLGIEKFIGDNDIVGIKTIPAVYRGMEVNFEFKGVFKLDKYHYRLTFSAG